jgi:hypothetical protein
MCDVLVCDVALARSQKYQRHSRKQGKDRRFWGKEAEENFTSTRTDGQEARGGALSPDPFLALLAMARAVGWIAHASEQLQNGGG